MMTRLLYFVGFLSLCAAGTLFAYSGMQWYRKTPADADELQVSLAERVKALQEQGTDYQDTEPALVRQAKAFALYLDPPAPPPPPTAATPKVTAPPRPPITTPKFRLLSISYYQAEPEKSLALVSEPGKGGYWVQQGDHLGHLVIESIEEGGIVYRDGSQLHEMAMAAKPALELAQRKTVQAAQPEPEKLMSNQGIRPSMRFLNNPQ